MIAIKKPAGVPSVLGTQGAPLRQAHIAEHDADPAAFTPARRGRKFPFEQSVYGAESVKRVLVRAQIGKCCFCESIVGDKGQVEHFRPKAASQQTRGKRLIRPGYYWLAYEWTNLYLICGPCNEIKRNLFPLRNSQQRARTDRDELRREEPLLLDPAVDDPAAHIGFRADIPYAIAGSPRGKATINTVHLDREDLNESRLQRLQLLRDLHRVVLIAASYPGDTDLQQVATEAVARLRDAEMPGAEFSAAAKWAIAEDFEFVPEATSPGARFRA